MTLEHVVMAIVVVAVAFYVFEISGQTGGGI